MGPGLEKGNVIYLHSKRKKLVVGRAECPAVRDSLLSSTAAHKPLAPRELAQWDDPLTEKWEESIPQWMISHWRTLCWVFCLLVYLAREKKNKKNSKFFFFECAVRNLRKKDMTFITCSTGGPFPSLTPYELYQSTILFIFIVLYIYITVDTFFPVHVAKYLSWFFRKVLIIYVWSN